MLKFFLDLVSNHGGYGNFSVVSFAISESVGVLTVA